jgi:hypothetical protein
MATRALIGYLENGVLTTTYNHYDGYPENLGKALNNFFNSPTLAKDIANYGYVSYIDPETGEIEAANQDTPDKLDLNKMDPENAVERVAGLVDSYGADYAYFYSPNADNWDVVKNNGIRSMFEPLEGILYGDFDNTYDEEEMNEDLISKAKTALKDKPNLDAYLTALKNDIERNGKEGYSDYTTDDDWEEDYFNYTAIDEAFAHQMKYKAGIIK